jgi:hypothetical protein
LNPPGSQFLSEPGGCGRHYPFENTAQQRPCERKDSIMRTIMKAALALGLALGFVGAIAVAAPGPVRAQGFYLYGPGLHVEVHRPWYRHHRHYYRYGEPYAYYGAPYACPPHWEWNPRYGKCTSNYD